MTAATTAAKPAAAPTTQSRSTAIRVEPGEIGRAHV